TPKLADGAVTAAKLADGAVTSTKLASGLASARPQFLGINTHDSGGVGQHSSIALGVDGLPIIAYYDETNQRLRVLHCNSVDCATSTVNTVDPGPDVGQDNSIVISPSGLAVISYRDVTNKILKIAYCADVVCTSATTFT